MKNGLYQENGALIYYHNGHRKHAGVVRVDGEIYYIGSGGRAVKGTHIVHREMTNDIIKHGTYEFGEDYRLIPDSYAAPERTGSDGRRFLRKKSPWTLTVISVLVILDLFVTIRSVENYGYKVVRIDPTESSFSQAQTDEVLLCSNPAKQLSDGKISVRTAIRGGSPYRAFELETEIGTEGGTLSVSETTDFKRKTDYSVSAGQTSVTLDNLKTGTTYFYKSVIDGKEQLGTFVTAKSVRFVSLPGVKNTRDIGGPVTLDGKTVRQGVLIRGSEIDGLVEPSCFLDREYVTQAQKEFGFVCDADLRSQSVFGEKYQSRFGKNVKHLSYRDSVEAKPFSAEFNRALRAIFADLAKPENYPMYLHCTDGASCTGTVCYLLEGVLNLPEDVMIRDYQLSGYYLEEYASAKEFNTLNGGVEGYKGTTVQEKIANYLTATVGVTEAELRSIRRIYLK